MKVTIKDGKKHKFPSLWIGNESNCIVLFYSHGVGVVLDSGDASALKDGQYVDNFGMENFTLFNGSVVLSND